MFVLLLTHHQQPLRRLHPQTISMTHLQTTTTLTRLHIHSFTHSLNYSTKNNGMHTYRSLTTESQTISTPSLPTTTTTLTTLTTPPTATPTTTTYPLVRKQRLRTLIFGAKVHSLSNTTAAEADTFALLLYCCDRLAEFASLLCSSAASRASNDPHTVTFADAFVFVFG